MRERVDEYSLLFKGNGLSHCSVQVKVQPGNLQNYVLGSLGSGEVSRVLEGQVVTVWLLVVVRGPE